MIGEYGYNHTRVREIREERACGLVEAKRIAKGEDLLAQLDRLEPDNYDDFHRLVYILKQIVKDNYA